MRRDPHQAFESFAKQLYAGFHKQIVVAIELGIVPGGMQQMRQQFITMKIAAQLPDNLFVNPLHLQQPVVDSNAQQLQGPVSALAYGVGWRYRNLPRSQQTFLGRVLGRLHQLGAAANV